MKNAILSTKNSLCTVYAISRPFHAIFQSYDNTLKETKQDVIIEYFKNTRNIELINTSKLG